MPFHFLSHLKISIFCRSLAKLLLVNWLVLHTVGCSFNRTAVERDGILLSATLPRQNAGAIPLTLTLANRSNADLNYYVAFSEYPDMELRILNEHGQRCALTEKGRHLTHEKGIHYYTRIFGIAVPANAKRRWTLDLAKYFVLTNGHYFLTVEFPINASYYDLLHGDPMKRPVDQFMLTIERMPFSVYGAASSPGIAHCWKSSAEPTEGRSKTNEEARLR